MKCRHKASRLIIPYADNQLSDEKEIAMVREHLSDCKSCRDELKEHKKFVEWLKPLKLVYPSEERFREIFENARRRVEMRRELERNNPKPVVIFDLSLRRLKPAVSFALILVFLISGFLYLKLVQPTQPISSPAKVKIDVPNAQIQAGGNTQLYLKPEKDGSTAVGVVYTYDAVSVLTKRNNINLTSGTTAYVYPDGTISEPEKISEEQLKIWKGESFKNGNRNRSWPAPTKGG